MQFGAQTIKEATQVMEWNSSTKVDKVTLWQARAMMNNGQSLVTADDFCGRGIVARKLRSFETLCGSIKFIQLTSVTEDL